MTKGIIQKVISDFLHEHHPIRGYYIITSDEILELQQELITEIEKEINENKINGFMAQHAMVLSKAEVLQKLIGDNKQWMTE